MPHVLLTAIGFTGQLALLINPRYRRAGNLVWFMVTTVLTNALWIVGLAVLLAAFSTHYDEARRAERPLKRQLQGRSFARAAWIGVTLVGAGLAATSQELWEAGIWILFTLYAVYNALRAWRGELQGD